MPHRSPSIIRIGKTVIILVLLLHLTGVDLPAQPNKRLPRSTPEAQGVSSEGILRFLEAAEESPIEFHSMMLLRNGKVIAEGWWSPYRADLKHTMYSVSKSWTSTAIGFAVSEKLISVDDKVIKFFPDKLPDTVSNFLQELSIKHLLSMTVGHDPDPTFEVVSNADDWIKAFFEKPIDHKPGSRFLYNTLATYMLSAIVQKVTGQRVVDYLKPRLFDPLGIQDVDSEIDPLGINTGGWGLRIRTEAMAKLGQFYLNKGKWNGKQILPQSWIQEATRSHIEQAPHATRAVKDSSDWLQGYGYQFWRTRNNAYRADGAYGQFIVVLPEKDMVIVFTAETPDMQSEINLAWQHLLPAVREKPLAPNPKAREVLQEKLKNLSLPVSSGEPSSPLSIANKSISLEANDFHVEQISFTAESNQLNVTMQTPSDVYEIPFGFGKWAFSETRKHGPYLVSGARAKFAGLPPFKVAGAYAWKNANTLELTLRFIESPHTEIYTLTFDNNSVIVEIVHSLNPGHGTRIIGKM